MHPWILKSIRLGALLALVLVLSGVPGMAQPDRVRNRANLRVVQPSVFTPARRAVDAGQWNEAVRHFQRLIEDPNLLDAVVVVEGGHYEGVLSRVRRELEALPEPGVNAYRIAFDVPARLLLNDGRRLGDPKILDELLFTYPAASCVGEALRLRALLHLERDEPQAAMRSARSLVERRGKAEDYALLGLSLARMFDVQGLVELVSQLPGERHGDELAGVDGTLIEYLRGLFFEIPPEFRDTRDLGRLNDSWVQPGGNADHTQLQGPDMELPERSWQRAIRHLEYAPFREERTPFSNRLSDRSMASFQPYRPTVSEGVLYVNSDIELQAINLFGKRAKMLWPPFRAGIPDGEFIYDDRTAFSNTVYDGMVYAPLVTHIGRNESRMYLDVTLAFPRLGLHAIDAYTGQLRWVIGGKQEELADDRNFSIDNISFPVAPTVVDGQMFAGGVYQNHVTDPFKHYVVSLDPKTGEILWKTFVASGMLEMNLFNNSIRDSIGSAVTVSGDTIFYLTNLGACAALERHTGRIKWIRHYDQIDVEPVRHIYPRREESTWMNNPPIVHNGVVYFTPMDSVFLFAVDLVTGEELWRFDRSSQRRLNLQHMVGPAENHLILSGTNLVALDMNDKGKVAWSLPAGRITGRGRPAVSESFVYFPAVEGLYRVIAADGRIESLSRWPTGSETGSLLLVDDALIASTVSRVMVFHNPSESLARWKEMAEKYPENPIIGFKLALKELQSGQLEEGIERLERSLELIGERPRPELMSMAVSIRKRLVSVYLELGEAALAQSVHDVAIPFFARAYAVAEDPLSVAESGLAYARALMTTNDDAGAVRVYRELMARFPDHPYLDRPVYVWAVEGIREIVRSSPEGEAIYRELEAEARGLLEAARVSGMEEDFEKVVYRFPNSQAAPAALLDWARLRESLGNPDGATRLYRQILREYEAWDRVGEAMVELVKALERRELFGAAKGILRRMQSELAEQELEVDGQKVKLGAFAASRLKQEVYRTIAGRMEDVELYPPLEELWSAMTQDPGSRVFALPDLPVLVSEHNTLKALHAASGDEMWTAKLPGSPIHVLRVGDGVLVSVGRALAVVEADSGELRWVSALSTPVRQISWVGNLVISIRASDRGPNSILEAHDPATGDRLWVAEMEGALIGALHELDDRVLGVSHNGGVVVVASWNLDTGAEANRIRLSSPYRPSERLIGDRHLALIDESRTIRVLQLSDLKVVWTKAFTPTSTVLLHEGGDDHLAVLVQDRSRARDESLQLMVYAAENGEIVAQLQTLDIAQPRHMAYQDGRLLLTSWEKDQRYQVQSFDIKTLDVQWETGIQMPDPSVTFLPLIVTRNHVVVPMARYNLQQSAEREKGWNPEVHILPLNGSEKGRQKLEWVVDGTMLPQYLVGVQRLIAQVGHKIWVFDSEGR